MGCPIKVVPSGKFRLELAKKEVPVSLTNTSPGCRNFSMQGQNAACVKDALASGSPRATDLGPRLAKKGRVLWFFVRSPESNSAVPTALKDSLPTLSPKGCKSMIDFESS
jgi:hypothetical protein